ncbi:MAG: prolyl aminopeptidase [Rhodobacteraceae bacterium]|nr:prolyl aminopeptidase [Paracoccaceae bacterium]
MNKILQRFRSAETLYPVIQPFDTRMLPVGGDHQLYIEQCGAPNGFPVLVLHGGPGGGCNPMMRRFFDPGFYRAVLFDQRGCGKSRPFSCVKENTTQHLIRDMELIRQTLGIGRWVLFGGSWGATLALLYAQQFPDRVTHLVLRAPFLMTRRELDWFYAGGAARFRPESWERFTDPIPRNEHDDLISAYHRRLFSGDVNEEIRFGTRWLEWESTLCRMNSPSRSGNGNGAYARTFARLETHYFLNRGFLDEDGQILAGMHRIADIPGSIIHGRYDLVCPPESAWSLAKQWKRVELEFVLAGHAISETEIQRKLAATMNGLRTVLG